MWIFGHLGIGSRLARPFSRGLPIRYVLLGTVLPDLIDKPLYYLAGSEIGLISSTRTLGHTGLLILLFLAYAFARKSRAFAAVGLGMATHLLLDGLQDAVGIYFFGQSPPSSTLLAALFPFHSSHFADYPFQDIGEHARTLGAPITLVAEIFGLVICYRDFWRPQLLKTRRRN